MGKKNAPPAVKKSPQEIRQEIKSYIRNERDTILKKWMALEESVHSEDRQRENFYAERTFQDTRVLPTNIQKFLGTLRRSVRKTMRDKGGTPFSIIRSMFLYWDADKSGEISAKELKGAMQALGVIMTDEERNEVVAYYDSGKGTNEMNYLTLLKDIQRGEPGMLAFVDKQEEEMRNAAESRFDEVTDGFQEMPPLVKQFVEAVQNYVATKMRNEGSTPYFHVRHLFQFYDYDYSNGLSPSELQTAAIKAMKLNITLEQAAEIVRYYDRKHNGQMEYDRFLPDVTVGVKPILEHMEFTPRSVAAAKASLAKNQFIPRPFQAAPNVVLARFKREVKEHLVVKVRTSGGSIQAWIKEAFSSWDPKFTKKITNIDHLIGAAKRLGVTLTPDEAQVLMNSYDRYGNGEMHYYILIDELLSDEPHFLSDSTASGAVANGNTSHTNPSNSDNNQNNSNSAGKAAVNKGISRIKTAVEAFAVKSKGHVNPRDILHGTFLRFDSMKNHRLSVSELRQFCTELKVRGLNDNDLQTLCIWFDTNGTRNLDYNEFIRQVYGDDVTTKVLVLPALDKLNGTVTMNSTSQQSLNKSCSTSKLSQQMSKSRSHLNDMNTTEMLHSTYNSATDKNLQPIESVSAKLARQTAKKKEILSERAKIEAKLASIEDQRKAIIEDYKQRHPKPKW